MSTSKTYQQSLANVGSETRPPMLERGSYIPWASKFRRYINRKRENQKWINKALDEGDALLHYDAEMELMNLILLSILNDIYNSVDACTSAKDMWKRVERLMRGIIQNKVDRETRFTNEFDQFVVEPGEALVSVYNHFAQLMNDLEKNDMHFPIVTINKKFLNSLQPEWLKYVTQVRLAKRLTVDTFDDLFYYLQQFEKLVNVSRAKKLEKSHDPLALVAHTGSSSRNTSSYYVTHPTSVVDYEDEYQQDDVHTNSEDPLTSAMLNSRNAGRNNRRAYVQEEIIEGSNAPNETGNVQRTLRTSSSGNTLTVQCYNCSGKGHYARNCPKPRVRDSKYFMEQMMEEIEELSANICLMARIQSADNTSDAGPSYDYAFISKVQSSSNTENEEQMYPTHTKIINSTIGDDQIDSDIIFDSPNRNVKNGSIEKDTHVPDLCALEQLTINAYKKAEKQQIFAQKDRDIIRDLEKQRDKLDLAVNDYKHKNEELQKTHLVLKRQMSENKDRYHDNILDLEGKLKKNVDLMLKLGNSLQGMFMLGPKPLSVYDPQLKHGLGNVGQLNYHKKCTFRKDLRPQKELSAEQKYFPSSFIPSDNTSNATSSIPASMPSESPLIIQLDKMKNCFQSLSELIQKNCKRASIFYTSPKEIQLNDFCQDQVKPIVNELQFYFELFRKLFQRDIKEMKNIFESTENELCEIKKQNDFLKDQLVEASLKHEVEISVLINHECEDNSVHAELEQAKKNSIEIQEGLHAKIKILEKDVQRCQKQSVDFELKLQHAKEKHKWESTLNNKNTNPLDYSWISKMEKLENENVSLDFKVQSLMKERDNVKIEYQKLFDSIKKTRSQSKKEMDELIAHVSEKTYAYGAIRAENQNLLSIISELKTRLETVEKVSKPVTLQTSPDKQRGAYLNKNVIAPGMYRVVTTQESQINEAKSDLSSTGMNAASSVRRPMNRDSYVKNSVLVNSKNSAKKVAVFFFLCRKYKATDNTSANVISNKENVNDVNVANAAKVKTLLCVSCMQNVLISCHDKCLAKYKLNVHSNDCRALSTNSRTPTSSDTTYVVLKTRTFLVRNLEGDDLLTGGHESNLYTISISDMAASSPVCLMSKATSTKSCTKLPEIHKGKFIAQAQLNYKSKVYKIRTDNGTELKNATLKAPYEKLGIMQQFSTARTPKQNGVVERRNRTLVEAARTMLIFSRLPEFLWAEAVATTCFTQIDQSFIHDITKHLMSYYADESRMLSIFMCLAHCDIQKMTEMILEK
ncbi:integrase, catalytic region, zinc finger, CCHC-type containing protein [Tanacetum coccineum]